MASPPSPDRTLAPDGGSESLRALAALGRDLAGAVHPSTAVERAATTLRDSLGAQHLLIILTERDSARRRVAVALNYATAGPDDPIADAVISNGPRVLASVADDEAARLEASLGVRVRSWVGAPIAVGDHPIGAVVAVSADAGHFGPWHLDFLMAALAPLAAALENARLLQLLSSGKREWEQTVDALGAAFCVVDRDGAIRRANRAFSTMVRVPVTALGGQAWMAVLPPAWIDTVTQALITPHAPPRREVRAGDRVFALAVYPLDRPQETSLLVFEDETEKRRLQEQLVQSEKMSAIGQLIAGVAHDLNNPLASVVGFADYLVEETEAPSPRLSGPLQAIRDEAERAAGIVQNLLTFARKHERRRSVQPIEPLLKSTLLLLNNQLMASKVATQLHIEPNVPDVEIDANQIQQVFVNIVNNASQAIHASGTGGQVTIRAEPWHDGLCVTIADDGPGVPETIADRIFEPFFTTKAEGEGTGLGLSISHGIVREHGGRLSFARAPAGGSIFRIELPTGSGTREVAPPAPVQTGTLSVLVVDDEPHILHYMSATLEAWGHTVQVAADGQAALSRIAEHDFHVVITDLRMPGMPGRELYERLSATRPEIARRVVFATGDTLRDDALQFLEEAGRPLLRKPFSLAQLRAVLGEAAAP